MPRGSATQVEMSALVYTVHPLPEPLMAYVWDFDCLNPADERAYMTAMVT